jgi:hypothetical protein
MSTQLRPNPGRTLAWGDAICITLFAWVGQQTHGTLTGPAAAWRGFLENALPILMIWFLIAPFLRTYSAPTWRNLLYTWAVAVPVGVWLRYMVLGKPFGVGFLVFLAVALGFSLLFVLAWRGLYGLVRRRA